MAFFENKNIDEMSDEEIEKTISELPAGYISEKTISGKIYYYYQWRENNRVRSKYIKKSELHELEIRIEERKALRDALAKRRVSSYAQKLNVFLKNKISLGYQDFATMIERGFFYVDKTKLISEWWKSDEQVSLITRPRRFGKTLNMSMLYYFFSNNEKDRNLFSDLEISYDLSMMKIKNSFPTIFITFLSISADDREEIIASFESGFASLYGEFRYLLDSDKITPEEKAYFKLILTQSEPNHAKEAIRKLSQMLYEHYGKKTIILVDEYDTPLISAYDFGIWDQVKSYIRTVFVSTFKDNPYLEKACITGITRVAKEGIFSDLNNVVVCGPIVDKYSDCFGFTENEVFTALDARGLKTKEKVKEWYDGFCFGKIKDIYNPWSISNYLSEGEFRSYWINSGGTSLINKLLSSWAGTIQDDLSLLLEGKSINKSFLEEIDFEDLMLSENNLWALLLSSGYLNAQNVILNGTVCCELSVTNKETMFMFENIVKRWAGKSEAQSMKFCEYLICGNVDKVNEYLEDMIYYSVSHFDVGRGERRTLENFYHGFVLGLTIELKEDYIIRSNRESGLGRYDVMLEPANKNKPACILEFKVFDERKESSLEETAFRALNQIEEKDYEAELVDRGYEREQILKYGMAFHGKEVYVALKR